MSTLVSLALLLSVAAATPSAERRYETQSSFPPVAHAQRLQHLPRSMVPQLERCVPPVPPGNASDPAVCYTYPLYYSEDVMLWSYANPGANAAPVGVAAFDTRTHELLWRSDDRSDSWWRACPQVSARDVQNPRLFTPGRRGTVFALCANHSTVRHVALRSGTVLWQASAPGGGASQGAVLHYVAATNVVCLRAGPHRREVGCATVGGDERPRLANVCGAASRQLYGAWYSQGSGTVTAVCLPSGVVSFASLTGAVVGSFNGSTSGLHGRVDLAVSATNEVVALATQLEGAVTVRVWSATRGNMSLPFVLAGGAGGSLLLAEHLPLAGLPERVVLVLSIAGVNGTQPRLVGFAADGPAATAARQLWSLPLYDSGDQHEVVGGDLLTWTSGNVSTVRNVSLDTGRVQWQTPIRYDVPRNDGQQFRPAVGNNAVLVATTLGAQVLDRCDGAVLWSTTALPWGAHGVVSATITRGNNQHDGFLLATQHFANATTFSVLIHEIGQRPMNATAPHTGPSRGDGPSTAAWRGWPIAAGCGAVVIVAAAAAVFARRARRIRRDDRRHVAFDDNLLINDGSAVGSSSNVSEAFADAASRRDTAHFDYE
jgi:hypothetical protein